MPFNGARRRFLVASAAAGAGLVLAFYLSSRERNRNVSAPAKPNGFRPNAWLRIAPDGRVTITLGKSEMGQGVWTALPMLIAEELVADWRQIRVEQALANPLYGDQQTGGSSSIRSNWVTLREAGAVAREMLMAAAARSWGVPSSECRVKAGKVIHAPTGRQQTYGELAVSAAQLSVPEKIALKEPGQFRIIGKSMPGLDAPDKTNGRAQYGADVRLPGMLTATIAHCPELGGRLESVEETRARTVPGVRSVVRLAAAVAVVADTYWSARLGMEALVIKWKSPQGSQDSESLRQYFRQSAEQPGVTARNDGDVDHGLKSAARVLNAEYETPFQAHAAMEPMNCTAHVHDGMCEVWAPTQSPQDAQHEAARYAFPAWQRAWFKLRQRLDRGWQPPVMVHTTLLGGGFGRRLEQDYVAEAVQIARQVNAPVQLIWSREEDMQHGFYRPASFHQLSAGLDRNGMPVAWQHRMSGPSIKESLNPGSVKNGHDPTTTQGAKQLPYAIPNLRVQSVLTPVNVPCGYWRSVGHSNNAFVTECFLDELAAAGKKDPLAFRLALLTDAPRHRAVLELAAKQAGWARTKSTGRYQGIAVHQAYGSIVAQVAEVSVNRQGTLQVHRVVCAIDCGQVVNPNAVAAQMEGSVAFALSAMFKGEITIAEGRIAQSNFHNYPILRMEEMPQVDTHIVQSAEPPTGVGEPGVPAVIPAVLNAVFAATGRRLRRLPVRPEDLVGH